MRRWFTANSARCWDNLEVKEFILAFWYYCFDLPITHWQIKFKERSTYLIWPCLLCNGHNRFPENWNWSSAQDFHVSRERMGKSYFFWQNTERQTEVKIFWKKANKGYFWSIYSVRGYILQHCPPHSYPPLIHSSIPVTHFIQRSIEAPSCHFSSLSSLHPISPATSQLSSCGSYKPQ